jgi:hypothetical protein
MIQNVLHRLGGIANYGTLSLCLFVLVFTGVLVWALLQRGSHLDRMARVPLENDTDETHNPSQTHE